MRISFPFQSVAVIASFCFSGFALHAEPADDLIEKGNVYYDRLQASEALKYSLPAEKLEPKNVDLLVRISREYRHLMSDASGKEEKCRLGNVAIGYAKRAVSLAPNNPNAQLAVAISYGKLLPYEGNNERVEASRIIKNAAERVIKLDPSNDLGWHVLGRWHVTVADVGPVTRALGSMVYGSLPPASTQDAERCFEKAIALNPNRLMHYIEVGRTFAQMGKPAEARKFITKGLAMAETEKDDPETKEKGRQLLAKLN